MRNYILRIALRNLISNKLFSLIIIIGLSTAVTAFMFRATVIFGDQKFYEERMYFAEPQIFEIFDIKFITGNPASGISSANCAFISQSKARKYFGENDPMGQTISVDKEMSLVITGIF